MSDPEIGSVASSKAGNLSRRQAICAGAAATAAALLGTAEQATGQPATARATATAPATAAAPPTATAPATSRPARGAGRAAWLSADDVAVLDKFSDQENDASERTQVARVLSGQRDSLRRVRTFPMADGSPPAFHFDPYLPGMKQPGGRTSEFSLRQVTPPDYDGTVSSLAFRTVVDLHALLVAGKVTSVELTRMFIERLKTIGPKLMAVVTLMEDVALAQASEADKRIAAGERGPLLGVPYGLKDLFAARGAPTTFGVKPFEKNVIDDDADVVRLLRKAGAVLLCKASLGELAMGNVWFGGDTRNPWNIAEGSSGSSAGSAAGVAAGLFPFAIGTETHGSIISPCTVCGVTGLRPTFGRISRGGAGVLCWTLDKVGPITRTVEDAAIVFHTLHQSSADGVERDSSYRHVPFAWNGSTAASLEGLRIGIDRTGFAQLRRTTTAEKEFADACEAAAAKISELSGRPLIDVVLPSEADYASILYLIINCESAAAFVEMRRRGELEGLVQQADWAWPTTFRAGSMIPAVDYIRAMQIRAKLQTAMQEAMSAVDVMITPPMVGPALAFTNLAGHPALLTRAGARADGSPLSIKLIGQLDGEEAILRVGHAFEHATDWHTRWPTVW